MKSCHYLPSLSEGLKNKLRQSVDAIEFFSFLKRSREIMFSLKLSTVFSDLRRFCVWRTMDCYGLLLAMPIFLIAFPVAAFATLYSAYFVVAWDRNMKPILSKLSRWQLSISNTKRLARRREISPMKELGLTLPRAWRLFGILATIFILVNDTGFDILIPLTNQFTSFVSIPISTTFFSAPMPITTSFVPMPIILPLIIVCMVFFIPWYQFYYYPWPRIAWLPALAAAVVIVPFILLLRTIFGPILIVGIGVMACGWILFLFGANLSGQWRDARTLKTLQNTASISRQQIYRKFGQFRTRNGRLRYVLLLQNLGVNPTGMWPNGQIPNAGNDEASTLIAQLEEKWIGLDK